MKMISNYAVFWQLDVGFSELAFFLYLMQFLSVINVKTSFEHQPKFSKIFQIVQFANLLHNLRYFFPNAIFKIQLF